MFQNKLHFVLHNVYVLILMTTLQAIGDETQEDHVVTKRAKSQDTSFTFNNNILKSSLKNSRGKDWSVPNGLTTSPLTSPLGDLLRSGFRLGHYISTSNPLENWEEYPGSSPERIRRGADRDYESLYKSIAEEEEGCVGPGKWLALVSYTGLPMRIPCDPCDVVYGVTWTKRENSKENAIEFDSPDDRDRRVILGGDSAIYILETASQDEGVYLCKGEDSIISTYKVEIKTPGKMHIVRSPEIGGEGDSEPYANDQAFGHLIMYTDWTEWGHCSECKRGKTHGERARIGYCYAMAEVETYPLGLPCSSPEMSAKERKMYKKRLDEKMIEACEEVCPGSSIAANMTIFDRFLGKIMGNDMIIEGYEGDFILLECPGLGIESAVTWHNGTDLIDAEYLASTRGRVSIDILDGLQIFHLTKNDARMPYHCYVNGKRRQTFKLRVTKKVIDTNEIIESFIYIGILIGIYTLIFLIIMVAKHNVRRRSRVKKVVEI